jgi:hypothetical protein
MDEHKPKQKEWLTSLVVGNFDLERLERELKTFNIFAVLGVERSEVQHSNFLAYLLDPSEKHGLGDKFLKRFLQEALRGVTQAEITVTPLEIDYWELQGAEVLRERRNTDIFVSDRKCLVAVIENKIDSCEHDDQLPRYRRELADEFSEPNWKRLMFYLTPDGSQPDDENERKHWIAVDYGRVEKVLREVLDLSKELRLDDGVVFSLRHYLEVLRRHIVADSEIANLCRGIYRQHQTALDLIHEIITKQRVHLQSVAREFLKERISSERMLALDLCNNSEINFALADMDDQLPKGGTGTPSGRILLFAFWIEAVGLNFVVQVGPGPEEPRKKLFTMAGNAPFKQLINQDGFLKAKWNTIYKRELIGSEGYSLEEGEFRKKLNDEWETLKAEDIPKLANVIETAINSSATGAQGAT